MTSFSSDAFTTDAFLTDSWDLQATQLPIPTFPPEEGTGIVNEDAVPFPSNYEICDRTGFRLRRGELKEEWTGAMVDPRSWERRNVQDFVRGVGDELHGSKRPEQDDQFVTEKYPAGVQTDDL